MNEYVEESGCHFKSLSLCRLDCLTSLHRVQQQCPPSPRASCCWSILIHHWNPVWIKQYIKMNVFIDVLVHWSVLAERKFFFQCFFQLGPATDMHLHLKTCTLTPALLQVMSLAVFLFYFIFYLSIIFYISRFLFRLQMTCRTLCVILN